MATWVDEDGKVNDLGHHPKFLESYRIKLEAWGEAQERTNDTRRCGRCWLRCYQCYCTKLDERAELYGSSLRLVNSSILNYYGFKEIGRSPNTAHVMDELLPYASSRLIFGDLSSEDKLIDELCEEYTNHRIRSCILYPSDDAKVVSDWRIETEEYNAQGDTPFELGKEEEGESSKSRYRLISLDGTYSDARKMFHYLCLRLKARGVPIPVVKLDLGEEGFIKSAYLGIMHQPGREKICTFQAVTLALKDLGEPKEVCEALLKDLDDWIHYILEKKIKAGKEDVRVPSDLIVARGGGGRSTSKMAAKQATKAEFSAPASVTALHKKWVDESRHSRDKEKAKEGIKGEIIEQEQVEESVTV